MPQAWCKGIAMSVSAEWQTVPRACSRQNSLDNSVAPSSCLCSFLRLVSVKNEHERKQEIIPFYFLLKGMPVGEVQDHLLLGCISVIRCVHRNFAHLYASLESLHSYVHVCLCIYGSENTYLLLRISRERSVFWKATAHPRLSG